MSDRDLVIACNEIAQAIIALCFQRRACLTSASFGESNDQNGFHRDSSRLGGRVFHAGIVCPHQGRVTANPGASDDRQGWKLRAGSKRRGICLGPLHRAALHAGHCKLTALVVGPAGFEVGPIVLIVNKRRVRSRMEGR